MTATTSSNELCEELTQIRDRARDLVSDLTPEQLTRRPDPSNWSIIECLAHLNMTAAVVQPKVAAAIAKGKRGKLESAGPFSLGAVGRLLIWMAEPPPKFRLRAPKNIAPVLVADAPAQVVADFMDYQDGWERLACEAQGLDQNKIKVASPFRGVPRLRLAVPIPWMMAHQRRHLVQAEKVKQQIVAMSSAVTASA